MGGRSLWVDRNLPLLYSGAGAHSRASPGPAWCLQPVQSCREHLCPVGNPGRVRSCWETGRRLYFRAGGSELPLKTWFPKKAPKCQGLRNAGSGCGLGGTTAPPAPPAGVCPQGAPWVQTWLRALEAARVKGGASPEGAVPRGPSPGSRGFPLTPYPPPPSSALCPGTWHSVHVSHP